MAHAAADAVLAALRERRLTDPALMHIPRGCRILCTNGGPLMSAKDYTVGKQGDQWYVKRNDASRAAGVFDTQAEAAARGRELAKEAKVDLVIKGLDGKIRSKDSYGNDPPSRKDREH